jgi:hypothetical protein
VIIAKRKDIEGRTDSVSTLISGRRVEREEALVAALEEMAISDRRARESRRKKLGEDRICSAKRKGGDNLGNYYVEKIFLGRVFKG